MNKEYFTDNLSIEAIAEITDEILKFEKNNKSKNIKINFLKIIPAVACVLLIIGIINILPVLPAFQGVDAGSEANSIVKSDDTRENSMPSYAEQPELFPDIKSIEEAKSTLLGFMNNDGEIMYSGDGGETWFPNSEDAYAYLLENMPENSAVCYDDIEKYLIITVDGGETWMTKGEFEAEYPAPELEFWTYDEYKAWLDEQKVHLQKSIGTYYFRYTGENLTNGTLEEVEWTQEKVDEIIRFHEDQLEIIKGGVVKIPKTETYDIFTFGEMSPYSSHSSYSCSVDYTLPDGGKAGMGFGATSYDGLYKMVKTYLDEQVIKGNMTQEEADGKLAEMSESNTLTTVDGN